MPTSCHVPSLDNSSLSADSFCPAWPRCNDHGRVRSFSTDDRVGRPGQGEHDSCDGRTEAVDHTERIRTAAPVTRIPTDTSTAAAPPPTRPRCPGTRCNSRNVAAAASVGRPPRTGSTPRRAHACDGSAWSDTAACGPQWALSHPALTSPPREPGATQPAPYRGFSDSCRHAGLRPESHSPFELETT